MRIISPILTLILLFGIAVIIGSILGGPILLKRAITVPVLLEPEAEPQPGLRPEPEPESRRSTEADTAVEQPTRPRYPAPDDWAGDA